MQPNNFLHDGRQVSDRPENLVGPPALGYLVSWRRSWVVAQKCGGLRDVTIKHDKSSWRWHTKNCIVNLSYLLCCDGFRWVFNVSSSLLMYFGGGFGGIFTPIFIHCLLHGSSHCSISFVFNFSVFSFLCVYRFAGLSCSVVTVWGLYAGLGVVGSWLGWRPSLFHVVVQCLFLGFVLLWGFWDWFHGFVSLFQSFWKREADEPHFTSENWVWLLQVTCT